MLPEVPLSLKPGFGLGGIIAATLPGPAGRLLPPGLDADEHWMAEALRASMACVGLPAPNPAVGCAFVKDGKLLGMGGTAAWGAAHAERAAVADVIARYGSADAVKGASAYVTLEPCAHHGKQPPCAELLAGLGLAEVVAALPDPNPLVAGAGFARLEAAGVAVRSGVLAAECLAWHLPFLHAQRRGRPLVLGKWAQGLDGGLALADGSSRWISGPLSRSYTHFLRQKFDAIAVGAGTFLRDLPRLDSRDAEIPPLRQPLRIVLDPLGRLLHAGYPRLLTAPEGALRQNENTAPGAEAAWIWLLPREANNKETEEIWGLESPRGPLQRVLLDAHSGGWAGACLAWLQAAPPLPRTGLPLQSVLVEGGATLLSGLWEHDAFDAACAFIAPKFLGETPHRIGRGLGSLEPFERLRSCASHVLGTDTVLEFWDPPR